MKARSGSIWNRSYGGRPSLMRLRTMRDFRRMLRRFGPEHYRLRTAGDVVWRETNHNPGGQRFPVASRQPGTEFDS